MSAGYWDTTRPQKSKSVNNWGDQAGVIRKSKDEKDLQAVKQRREAHRSSRTLHAKWKKDKTEEVHIQA